MDVFNFPYHKVEKAYPETGGSLKFGESYEFRSAPTAPDQVVYTLSMMGMRYYRNSNGTFNRTINPTTNILFLEDFYNTQKRYKKFQYVHDTDGTVVVRFKDPLKIPTAIEGGTGLLPEFTLTLELQP
jgi:hypothetical protein